MTWRPTTCALRFPGSGGQAPITSAIQGYALGAASIKAAIDHHYFSLVIFDFGDTAAVDRQVTADMRQAGGYYVLGRPGRFTIWASADKASRLAGSTGARY